MTTLNPHEGVKFSQPHVSCCTLLQGEKKLKSVKVFKAALNSPREEKKCEGTRKALCRMNKRTHCVPTRGMATGILE
jgi:hypothetical protein